MKDNHAPTAPNPAARSRAWRSALKYGAARFGLFVALTTVIQTLSLIIGAPVPLVMSALLALIVAFPLSMLIFSGMRREATEAVGEFSRQRKEHRQWVREELASR